MRTLLVLLMLTLVSAVSAQTPPACGVVGIDGPSEIDPGTPVVFKAKTSGITKPQFKWSVSVGTIMAGQGTDQITVDTTNLGGQEMIASLEVPGVPLGCNGSASRTTQLKVPPIACGIAFDEYGDIAFRDEKARLDNFAIQLINVPQSTGLIMMSAGRETFRFEAAERLNRAKSYLANVRDIDPKRITTFDCGFTQDLTIHLYIVPFGVSPPACNSSLPLSAVKFTKLRPKSSRKPR